MPVYITLFIGQNPPGVSDDLLLEYLEEYIKLRLDSFGHFFGCLTIYLSTIPRFVNSYQDFVLDLESVPIDAEQQSNNLKSHFFNTSKRIRDIHFANTAPTNP